MCISVIKFSSNGEGQVTQIEKMGNVKFYLLIFPNVQETGTSMNFEQSFPADYIESIQIKHGILLHENLLCNC